ncbi:MAG TPA: hypothetical protein VE843_11230 [Ktedonobacteraceae bacterium]|nr:hypothetical protein [Ktedonobacteraceae bacterium]
MISQDKRQFRPHFDKRSPRFFRGYGRSAFFYGHQRHHRSGSHWQQPTAEQQALRSSAVEVAQLFAIAARKSHGDAAKQSQLRAFLDRSRQELSDFVYGISQDSK